MNERMTQLHVEAARYAKEKYPNDIVEWSICMSEKFAEFIVKECITQIKPLGEYPTDGTCIEQSYWEGCNDSAEQIKDHFGVKE